MSSPENELSSNLAARCPKFDEKCRAHEPPVRCHRRLTAMFDPDIGKASGRQEDVHFASMSAHRQSGVSGIGGGMTIVGPLDD
jgi:hypothetical protein